MRLPFQAGFPKNLSYLPSLYTTRITSMKKILFFFAFMAFGIVLASAQTPEIGIAADMEKDSLLNASGYGHLVESIGKIMSPRSVSDEQFKKNLRAIKNLKTPLYAVNIFLPGELKTVGPNVDEQAILAYTDQVFRRCREADVSMVVWGSGGSRRLPEGFSKEKATEQFVAIAKKIAVQASQYDIQLTLENLNSGETNFLNLLSEVHEVVKRVDEPNFRVCVDIYHMLRENEPASVIEEAGALITHCDIAEKEKRTPPGTMGDDLTPYLKALKKAGFQGKIILECRWDDFDRQAPIAKRHLEEKIAEVYGR